MAHRIDDLPCLARRPDVIPAPRFNRVRLALARLGAPLRFNLPGMPNIDMELDHRAWMCIDKNLNDLPVLAWTAFAKREALHAPVACELRFYHVYASAIRGRALELMDALLEARLHPSP